MKLPDLPKQNKKQEATSSLKFREWWERDGDYAPYEMKDSRGKNYFKFSEISDDQYRIATLACSKRGVLIRIERGTEGSPDYMGLRNTKYYFVIKYPLFFAVIHFQALSREMDRAKSLTYQRAQEIAEIII